MGSRLLLSVLSIQVTFGPAVFAALFKSGYFRTAMRRTTTGVKALLAGLLVVLVSAGTIFAASQDASQGNKTTDVTRTFGFSGDLGTPLSPGATVPLDLSISNPSDKSLSLNRLSVSITGISQTQAAVAAALPCTPADYVISNYTGSYPLTIPVGHSSLQSLEIPPALWPKVSMLDTSLNQDGCKGATLNLAYSGAQVGN